MTHHNFAHARRSMLRNLAGGFGSIALGSGASIALPGLAQAQTNDYKAIVCLYLYGGNDGMNTIVPMDDSVAGAGYTAYAAERKNLAIAKSSLVALDGSRFGLHPALAPLAKVWNDGAMALVHNVGPLSKPMTQAEYVAWRDKNDKSLVPESLYSHSDQQHLWQNGTADGFVTTGWGGLLAEQDAGRQVISFGGNSLFGAGQLGGELVLPEPGNEFGLRGYWNDPSLNDRRTNARRGAMDALINDATGNLLHSTFSAQRKAAFNLSSTLSDTMKIKPGSGSNPLIDSAFNNLTGTNYSRLSKQLYQVAKMVEASGRAKLGGNQHVFFVSLGGFDTHAGQLTAQNALLGDVGVSVASFYTALKNLGLADKVTLFTASDFGRTLKINASGGTDHAWGNEHFVVGAGVQPKASVGQYPILQPGGPNDASDPKKSWEFQGRWIPTTSVSQYSGALAKWLNPTTNLTKVLPSLSGFGPTPLANIALMK
jgi:uncharacterized protein (DUF1501 family)